MTPNTPKIATFLSILLPILAFSIVDSASSHAAPSPAVDCTSLVASNMAECLSFVAPGSTIKKPEGSCCNGLKTVLKTNADCLCQGFKNSANMGIAINVTKALALPSACHVSAPSVTNCGLSLVPGTAPAMSPMASSPSAFAGGPASIGGSVVSPAQAPGSSSSLALSVSAGLLVLSLFAASSLTLF